MISLSEEVTIPSPSAEVWPLLRDPALVASCIPGATLTAEGEGGAYRGTIRVKFGPTVATFRGEAKLAYDDAARRCTIEGRGIDGRGASRALASGVVTASGTATTVLKVEGNFNVTGPLETFANAGGVHLARELLVEFAGNMARVIAERSTRIAEPDRPSPRPSPRDAGSPVGARVRAPVGWRIFDAPGDPRQREGEGQPPSPPLGVGAGELRGGRLLWRAFLGWLRQIFFAKRQRGSQ